MNGVSLTAIGVAIAFFFALAGCAWLRAFSLRKNLLDHPNERSLHSTPVPRLGGVAIALATWLGLLAIHAIERRGFGRLEFAWLVVSIPIAALGLIDDLRSLNALPRLLLQFAGASLFCWLAGIPHGIPLFASSLIALPPWASLAVWAFFIVAVLNIFNFMDGMDGLAGTQALGASAGIGAAFALAHQPALAMLCAVLAGASLGFLFQNFPPAKIFMGDAGSTFLGYSFAALAVAGADAAPSLPSPVFALALAPFLLDGTYTLLRRALRGEAVWKAHRSHLYQRAVTAGRSHHDVLMAYSLWIAIAAAAAVCAARAGAQLMAALVVCLLAAFCAVLGWVHHLSKLSIQSDPDSRSQATSSTSEAARST